MYKINGLVVWYHDTMQENLPISMRKMLSFAIINHQISTQYHTLKRKNIQSKQCKTTKIIKTHAAPTKCWHLLTLQKARGARNGANVAL